MPLISSQFSPMIVIGFLALQLSGCGLQRVVGASEEAVMWGQVERQKQQELSDRLLGKDQPTILEMWGKPDAVDEDAVLPRYYVGYYENADKKFLEGVYEKWTYVFPRKRGPVFIDMFRSSASRIPVHLYFKDGKVVFVGL